MLQCVFPLLQCKSILSVSIPPKSRIVRHALSICSRNFVLFVGVEIDYGFKCLHRKHLRYSNQIIEETILLSDKSRFIVERIDFNSSIN